MRGIGWGRGGSRNRQDVCLRMFWVPRLEPLFQPKAEGSTGSPRDPASGSRRHLRDELQEAGRPEMDDRQDALPLRCPLRPPRTPQNARQMGFDPAEPNPTAGRQRCQKHPFLAVCESRCLDNIGRSNRARASGWDILTISCLDDQPLLTCCGSTTVRPNIGLGLCRRPSDGFACAQNFRSFRLLTRENRCKCLCANAFGLN